MNHSCIEHISQSHSRLYALWGEKREVRQQRQVSKYIKTNLGNTKRNTEGCCKNEGVVNFG